MKQIFVDMAKNNLLSATKDQKQLSSMIENTVKLHMEYRCVSDILNIIDKIEEIYNIIDPDVTSKLQPP